MGRRAGRATVAATVLGVAVLLAGCGEEGLVPAEPPTVSGVVGGDAGPGAGPSLAEASDDYYEGMALVTEGTVVLDDSGDEVDAGALEVGAEVDVWTGDACAESYPVQCGIEVVRVVG